LEHVVSVGFDEVGEFVTVRDDRISFEYTPMLTHLQRFKAFQLYYRNKTCWGEGPMVDDVVSWKPVSWKPNDLTEYSSSKAYHDDYAAASHYITLKASQISGGYDYLRETSHGSRVNSTTHPVTMHEFHQGIKQDNKFNQNLKVDKYSNTLNQPNTKIDHIHFVFNDEDDVPKDWNERAVFGKIQFLHTILEECLNRDHAKALSHPYGEHHEANNVYLELKKHVLELTMD
jgi:hypothetical protein